MPVYKWGIFDANLNPETGSVKEDRKPVLVVSNEENNQAMPDVTAVPLISTKGMAGRSMDSVVMAHQMRSIPKNQLGEIQGFIDDSAVRRQISDAIKEHLDIE